MRSGWVPGTAWVLTLGAWLAGCSGSGTPPPDGTDGGTGTVDAAVADAGRMDSGTRDAGLVDAGTPDAGALDAATADAARADAGVTDAGGQDASAADAAVPDASLPDAALPDASTHDAGGAPDAAMTGGDAGMRVDAGADPCAAPEADRTGTGAYTRGAFTASVARVSGTDCARTWRMSSNAPLRDNQPGNLRTVVETATQPVLQSGHDGLDAVFALAVEEARQNSVASLREGAFNNGNAVACPAGGCFETGRLWTWAWTRDTAYAVDLGLGMLDPVRSANTLDFKLSTLRDGTRLQVVQDTGTGGAWPVSTDRVAWVLGAEAVLEQLDGAARAAFQQRAYTALRNTVEADRAAAWDARLGLYRGESSFLDWREQTYPPWTATTPAHIASSMALSTNVLHLRALRFLARTATAQGMSADAARFAGWADDLHAAIRAGFLHAGGYPGAFITTTLGPSPVERMDLLGMSLAVLEGVLTESESRAALSAYPHLPAGVPVIFPQQKETPIYHNRATWPFVSAYAALAGRRAGHPDVVSHAVESLLHGAMLNLSHMENWEVVTGRAYLEDGVYSGPVVNSQRQLWSVGGFLGLVERVLLGVEHVDGRMKVAPFIPWRIRNSLLRGTSAVVLRRVAWRGKTVDIRVDLPPVDDAKTGALVLSSATLAGVVVPPGGVEAASITDGAEWRVTLQEGPSQQPLRRMDDVSDYRVLFGPRPPRDVGITREGGALRVSWDPNGELADDVTFAIYRDGVRVADGLSGTARSHLDTTATPGTSSHCYAVEATFRVSGNRGQHSPAACWWGDGYARITAQGAMSFTVTGGNPSTNHGRFHHENWGADGHVILGPVFTAGGTGRHLVHVVAGNGGPLTTGITCGHKRVQVLRDSDGSVVGTGYAVMPHLGDWGRWDDSTYVDVELQQGVAYRVRVDGEAEAFNMSALQSSALYGGAGGASPANFVNIAEIKILRMTGP